MAGSGPSRLRRVRALLCGLGLGVAVLLLSAAAAFGADTLVPEPADLEKHLGTERLTPVAGSGDSSSPEGLSTEPLEDPGPAVKQVGETTRPSSEIVADAAAPVADIGRAVAQTAARELEPVVDEAEPVVGPVGQQAKPFVEPVETTVDAAVELVSPVVDPLVEIAGPMVDPIVEVINPVVDPIVDVIDPVVDPIAEVVDPIVDVIDPIVGPIVDAIDPMASPGEDLPQPLGSAPQPMAPPVPAAIATMSEASIPSSLRHASGGHDVELRLNPATGPTPGSRDAGAPAMPPWFPMAWAAIAPPNALTAGSSLLGGFAIALLTMALLRLVSSGTWAIESLTIPLRGRSLLPAVPPA